MISEVYLAIDINLIFVAVSDVKRDVWIDKESNDE